MPIFSLVPFASATGAAPGEAHNVSPECARSPRRCLKRESRVCIHSERYRLKRDWVVLLILLRTTALPRYRSHAAEPGVVCVHAKVQWLLTSTNKNFFTEGDAGGFFAMLDVSKVCMPIMGMRVVCLIRMRVVCLICMRNICSPRAYT